MNTSSVWQGITQGPWAETDRAVLQAAERGELAGLNASSISECRLMGWLDDAGALTEDGKEALRRYEEGQT